VEHIGIQRTFEKMEQARVLIYMIDAMFLQGEYLEKAARETEHIRKKYPNKLVLLLANKMDLLSSDQQRLIDETIDDVLFLSAKTGQGLQALQDRLLEFINVGLLRSNDPVVSNTRHYEALTRALEAITKVQEGMADEVPSDLVSIDINQALYHLGEITGEISSDDLLGNIFANFCIGK
jgi:tRNA modification GTPase